MGFFRTRVTISAVYLSGLIRHGLRETAGSVDREVIFLLDGVGGFQFAPVLIRNLLRDQMSHVGTIVYRWQCGLPGEIWTDLMWYRRNRVMGARLARKLLAFRRAHPQTRIHIVAYSGGAGIAVFALEGLRRRPLIDTLILPCPALSPTYNLAPALRTVERAYVLISPRDRFILGWGTRIFGTTDRVFCDAAGQTGFRIPAGASAEDRDAYQRLRELCWTTALKEEGHYGGHTGWTHPTFLRHHFRPMLEGQPLLAVRQVACAQP